MLNDLFAKRHCHSAKKNNFVGVGRARDITATIAVELARIARGHYPLLQGLTEWQCRQACREC